jgi:shikimate dehydrogenase
MITGRTRVAGIVADPVAQAQSPVLVNALLAERGIDAVLVPLHVPAGGLERFLAGMRAVASFAGVLVSMPHKTAVVSLVDEVTREGREVGACNVVRREADGRLVASMFDGEGFVGGLAAAGHAVRGRRVLLVGAGGAASAIAFALARHGVAALTIHNRTAAKAAALAARVQSTAPAVEVRAGGADPAGHDLVVNGTALGMRLAEAARRGCVVHRGTPMLAAQLDLVLAFLGLQT